MANAHRQKHRKHELSFYRYLVCGLPPSLRMRNLAPQGSNPSSGLLDSKMELGISRTGWPTGLYCR